MADSLSKILGDWSAFYSAVAQVSGSLVGLLFVSLSMRSEMLRGEQHRDLRDLALQTFNDFLSVLMMSLLLLVPHMPEAALALIIGIFAGRSILRLTLRMLKLREKRGGGRYVLRRFGLSLGGNLMMLAAAAGLWQPDWYSPQQLGIFLVSPMIMLLMSGSNNALHLLLRETDLGSGSGAG